ncbi:MAG: ATP-dependent DNA helicase, partial [Candidatus Omnitrophota bacterium]
DLFGRAVIAYAKLRADGKIPQGHSASPIYTYLLPVPEEVQNDEAKRGKKTSASSPANDEAMRDTSEFLKDIPQSHSSSPINNKSDKRIKPVRINLSDEEKALEGLNDKQIEAVKHDQGPLLIIAGAGTGKTAVITRRIAHLISTKSAKPEEILALTFTDKAAGEMKERVDLLVPYGYTDIWISTFHAFGDRILRKNALELGLDPKFQVLSSPDQLILLRKHLYEFGLDYYCPKSNPTFFLEAIVTLFSRLRDEDVSWEEYLEYAKSLEEKSKENPQDKELGETAKNQMELVLAFKTYQELLIKEGKVDFANQVYLALYLFRHHPLVLKRYQEQFKYILVDEFQDTNFSQFQLVKLLAEAHKNIVVVGDDNQSIFKFRGAAISNILNFMDYYPQAKIVVLTENYRSTQTILNKAYQLIKYNDPDTLEVKCNISKKLTSRKENGLSIKHFHFDTGATEADEVARLIEEKKKNEGISFKEIAILVRSNNNAQDFLRALNMRFIPWRFSGSQGLYRQEEIRFLISFLRTLADLNDSISLYHLVSFGQVYNLDMTDLSRCTNWADKKKQSLFTVFRQLDKTEELKDILPKTKDLIGKIVGDLNYYLEEAANLSTQRLLELFLQRSGLEELLKEETTVNKQRRKNIACFFDIVANFKNLAVEDRVPNFVQHLNELISAGDDPATAEPDLDLEAVNVLTVHKAKGLEFRVVFLVNLVQGRFPLKKRGKTLEVPLKLVKYNLPSQDTHIQEERRLFYVGTTRAKDELIFTSFVGKGKRARKVSQFVFEALGESYQEPEVIKTPAIQEIKRFAPRVPTLALKEKPIASDELLVLSFSQIDDYISCPLKYYYLYVLRIPISRRHHSVVYGIAIHKAILDFYQAKINKISFTLEDMFRSFQTAWKSEGFLSQEHEKKRFAQGKETLKRFYEREKDKPLPAYIEQRFSFVLGKNKVVGRWDRIDETPEGAVIIDFKTTDMVKKQEQANKRVKESLQLSIYALAYSIFKGELPLRVELHFVDTDLIGQDKLTEKDLEKTKELITQVSTGIRAQEFQASPEYYACEYCAYCEICPSTAVSEDFWSPSSSSPILNAVNAVRSSPVRNTKSLKRENKISHGSSSPLRENSDSKEKAVPYKASLALTAQIFFDAAFTFKDESYVVATFKRLGRISFRIVMVKYLVDSGKIVGPPLREQIERSISELSKEEREIINNYSFLTSKTWDEVKKKEFKKILKSLNYPTKYIRSFIYAVSLYFKYPSTQKAIEALARRSRFEYRGALSNLIVQLIDWNIRIYTLSFERIYLKNKPLFLKLL